MWTKHLSIPKAKAGPKEFRFRLVSLYLFPTYTDGPSWSWSYGSWIYNYLCNQCLSLLKLWVPIPLSRGVLDTTLCDKVCQWLAERLWFSPGSPVSSTNKTDCHDITKTLLKVMLKHHKPQTQTIFMQILKQFHSNSNLPEDSDSGFVFHYVCRNQTWHCSHLEGCISWSHVVEILLVSCATCNGGPFLPSWRTHGSCSPYNGNVHDSPTLYNT